MLLFYLYVFYYFSYLGKTFEIIKILRDMRTSSTRIQVRYQSVHSDFIWKYDSTFFKNK